MQDKITQLAIDHADWYGEHLKLIYANAFIHGYKHGKEK